MVDASVIYPFLVAVISVAAIGLRLPPHSSSLSIAHAVQGALPVGSLAHSGREFGGPGNEHRALGWRPGWCGRTRSNAWPG